MIKVLAVMDGTGTGGAETSMAAMAPLMAENGVEMEVAYFHDRSGAKEKFLEAGIPLHHVRPGRTRLATVWRLRKLIKERQPDLVHTMVYEADIIGRTAAFTARVPVVSSIINEMYGPEQLAAVSSAWKLRAAQLLDIVTARFVMRFHAITNTVADVMAPRLRIDRSKITVIYRGRDQAKLGTRSELRRRLVRSELGISDDTPLLLAVGRHEPQKGFDRLVDAMPDIQTALPGSLLVVAGRRGSVSEALERQVARLGLDSSVRWLGQRSDVADLLAACDVMVFPSRWEGLGSAVVEALMLDTPLVYADLTVLQEVVDASGAERLATPVDASRPELLAAAVVRQVRYSSRTDVAGAGQRMTAFQIEQVAAEYADLGHCCAASRADGDGDDAGSPCLDARGCTPSGTSN